MGGGMSFVKEPWQQQTTQKTNSVNLGQPTMPPGLTTGKRNPQTLSGGSSLPSGNPAFNQNLQQMPRRGTGGNSNLSPSESMGNSNFKTYNSTNMDQGEGRRSSV